MLEYFFLRVGEGTVIVIYCTADRITRNHSLPGASGWPGNRGCLSWRSSSPEPHRLGPPPPRCSFALDSSPLSLTSRPLVRKENGGPFATSPPSTPPSSCRNGHGNGVLLGSSGTEHAEGTGSAAPAPPQETEEPLPDRGQAGRRRAAWRDWLCVGGHLAGCVWLHQTGAQEAGTARRDHQRREHHD